MSLSHAVDFHAPKIAPHVVLERLYVATVLQDETLIDAHRVDPSAFTHEPYRLALKGMIRLRLDSERVTFTSLRVLLEADGYRDGAQLVSQLRVADIDQDLAPIAKRLRELARAREYASAAGVLKEAAGRCDIEACREIVGRMSLVHDAGEAEQPVRSWGEIRKLAAEAVLREGDERKIFIPLGIRPIDDSFKLSAAAVLVVGAQTGVGKSSFVQTALSNIGHDGVPAGLISLEDPDEDTGAKSLGETTGINPSRMWAGKLSPEERARILADAEAGSLLPISFAYVKSRELDDVLSRMEFMVRVRGVRVIAIDYLQAIKHRPGKDKRERIDDTLAELIALAGRLNIALIILSQMARNEKGNPFREPNIADLKESGEIENRAQCIVLLWRESDQTGMPTKVKVAKVKRGPGGRRFEMSRDPDTGMLVESSALTPPTAPQMQKQLDGMGNAKRSRTKAHREEFGG